MRSRNQATETIGSITAGVAPPAPAAEVGVFGHQPAAAQRTFGERAERRAFACGPTATGVEGQLELGSMSSRSRGVDRTGRPWL